MDGVCLTCGTFAALEAQHVAGRHNHHSLTVLVCRPCHEILTRWQYAAGIDLEERSPRTELDALRALAVSATHLVRLYAERHGDASLIPAPLAVHTERAISLLMDASGDPERPARWLPDPRVPPIDVIPVGPPTDDPARVGDLADLIRELSGELAVPPPLPPDMLRAVGKQPAHLQQAAAGAFADPRTVAEALALVEQVMSRGASVLAQLLRLPSFDHVDAPLLEEARVWIDTGMQLLEKVLTSVLPFHEGGQR